MPPVTRCLTYEQACRRGLSPFEASAGMSRSQLEQLRLVPWMLCQGGTCCKKQTEFLRMSTDRHRGLMRMRKEAVGRRWDQALGENATSCACSCALLGMHSHWRECQPVASIKSIAVYVTGSSKVTLLETLVKRVRHSIPCKPLPIVCTCLSVCLHYVYSKKACMWTGIFQWGT